MLRSPDKSHRAPRVNCAERHVLHELNFFTPVPFMHPSKPPLTHISGNSGQRKELTPYQRGIIVGLVSKGASRREVSRDLKVPLSTVNDTIWKTAERDEGKSVPRAGREKCLSGRDKRKVVQFARLHPTWTNKTLKAEAGVKCSIRTISRLLGVFNIKKWRAAQRPLLKEEHAIARKKWAEEHID